MEELWRSLILLLYSLFPSLLLLLPSSRLLYRQESLTINIATTTAAGSMASLRRKESKLCRGLWISYPFKTPFPRYDYIDTSFNLFPSFSYLRKKENEGFNREKKTAEAMMEIIMEEYLEME